MFSQNLKSCVDLAYLPGSIPMAYTDDETCKDFWTSALQPAKAAVTHPTFASLVLSKVQMSSSVPWNFKRNYTS